MTSFRFIRAAVSAAIAGLIAITAYLVVERAIASHVPIALCLQRLLQWDASNAYGAKAFDGGWPVALIGLGMDLIVSLVWGTIFTALYVRSAIVRQNVFVAAFIFGAVVMAVMLYAVVPIGHAMRMHDTVSNVVNVLVAHTIFFGIPVGLTVKSAA